MPTTRAHKNNIYDGRLYNERQGQPVTTRPVIDCASRDSNEAQVPLRYSFRQHLTQHVQTRACWQDVVPMLLALIGVIVVAVGLGTAAP